MTGRAVAWKKGPLFLYLGWAAVLIAHSLLFNFVTDDAYISFVYARNVAEHGELVFSVGHYVDGYTNFLWTVVLSLVSLLGGDLPIWSRILGTVFGIASLWIALLWLRVWLRAGPPQLQSTTPTESFHVAIASHTLAALLVCNSGFACWSSGGLETQMFTTLVIAAFALLWRYHLCFVDKKLQVGRWEGGVYGFYLAVVCGLACLTRPEGALVCALAFLSLLYRVTWTKQLSFKTLAWQVAVVVSVIAPWFVWHYWYYGHPLPNTYYVKAAGEVTAHYKSALWKSGFRYVLGWGVDSGVLFIAVGLFFSGGKTFWSLRNRWMPLPMVLAIFVGGYLVYVARVGGDFMGLYRFLMPVTVVSYVSLTLGTFVVVSRYKVSPKTLLVASLLLCGVYGSWQLQASIASIQFGNWGQHGVDTPAYLDTYAKDRATIGKHMQPCFQEEDFAIYGGAGAKPFYAQLAGIDVFGLVSDRIAHGVAPSYPRPGHNKWGPPQMLETYDPTFLFHCYSLHREPNLRRPLCREQKYWLQRGYERTTIHIPGLKQLGEYYTFLVKKERNFACKGVVPAE